MTPENNSKVSHLISQFKGFLQTEDIRRNITTEIPVFEFPDIIVDESIEKELLELNHPRNSVLGKRMESFFEIAINHSRRYELLSSNIQIIQDKTTIGELDFLLFDNERSKPIHVELVYKIYVYDEQNTVEEERWIGPNRKDSFSEKFEKLKTKQFPLLYREETKKYLKNYDLQVDDIEQQLCFKAQLYLKNSQNPDSEKLNLKAKFGKWYTYNEFTGEAFENSTFYAPKKNEWSALISSNENWFSYVQILKQIEDLFAKAKSPMIWMKTKNSYERFFVVWW